MVSVPPPNASVSGAHASAVAGARGSPENNRAATRHRAFASSRASTRASLRPVAGQCIPTASIAGLGVVRAPSRAPAPALVPLDSPAATRHARAVHAPPGASASASFSSSQSASASASLGA